MFTVIITGGLGSGKSTAAAHLAGRGAHVIDADVVAHEVLSAGSPLLAEVADRFGDDIVREDGSLDRAALAHAAFGSRHAAHELDAIVHPAVEAELTSRLRVLGQSEFPPTVVVIEVPLLVEAPNLRRLADLVIAVVAPAHVRVDRARDRGMNAEEAERRVRLQATDAERARLADIVVVNDGTLEEFERELDRVWDESIATGARDA